MNEKKYIPVNHQNRPGYLFFPVQSRFSNFSPGSLAGRFTTTTGSDAGSILTTLGFSVFKLVFTQLSDLTHFFGLNWVD
jgi:hypothetical protein